MAKKSKTEMQISPAEAENLLKILQERFGKIKTPDKKPDWDKIQKRLSENPQKLAVLFQMEKTGGEPAFVWQDKKSGEFVFVDCSAESPKDRRSLCYDRAAWEERKEARPKSSVQEMAATLGVEILTEADYFDLQKLGEFDLKTSTWLHTPDELRARGGAIFGDRRYGRVFIYHNGASSYYAARGFRGKLRV